MNDLKNQKFGRLLVLRRSGADKHNNAKWICRCDCGVQIDVIGMSLKQGNTRSCGCLRRDLLKTHGMSGGNIARAPEYQAWVSMKGRCYNPKNAAWNRYGGRGITICSRWKDSFENFIADMGSRPEGTSLDRINNDDGYSPSNCRWATQIEQLANRSRLAYFSDLDITHEFHRRGLDPL